MPSHPLRQHRPSLPSCYAHFHECPCRYAVPCNVGDTKMRYDLVVKTYYWIAIVISNTRCACRQLLMHHFAFSPLSIIWDTRMLCCNKHCMHMQDPSEVCVRKDQRSMDRPDALSHQPVAVPQGESHMPSCAPCLCISASLVCTTSCQS